MNSRLSDIQIPLQDQLPRPMYVLFETGESRADLDQDVVLQGVQDGRDRGEGGGRRLGEDFVVRPVHEWWRGLE